MESPVRLLFLGTARAEYTGQPVQGFESRKALALLAYLATRGEAAPRSQLAALFWPDQPDERGRGNLRRLLHNLSTRLPGCLAIDRQTVQLHNSWTDIAAFESLVAQGSLAARAEAAELYRGTFLDGLYLDDCPEVEVWLVQERERWHERAAHLLADLTARSRERREWDAGLRWVERLLALDPWREAAHQDKMRLLAQSGQRDSALAQYEICRHVLVAELGIEPSPETSALYEQIRDGLLAPPAAPALPRSQVPIPPMPLLGRAEELAQVVELLAQLSCRLLTLLGPGGVGKTRLALEIALQQQTRFKDGVWVVELAAIRDPALVAPTIAQSLGIPESGNRPASERVKDWLRDKHLLLYLDNFEQILAAAPAVSELLAACPRLVVLVTSRIPLRIRGEQEFVVGPLMLPDPRMLRAQRGDRTAMLASSAAAALFVERACMVKPDFIVTDETAPIIAEICVRLDGLPLALELAAARIKLFPPAALLARLERRLSVLTGRMQDRPLHQQTIRNTMEWSHQLLDAPVQALFARLSVFVGGWTLDMAEAIVVLDGPADLDVLDGMAALVDHSLVRQQLHEGGEPRFSMLETIHEYAAEQLAASAAADQLRHRHASVLLELAEDQRQRQYGQQRDDWWRQIEREHQNLVSALAWMREQGQVEHGIRLISALARPWRARGYMAEALVVLEDLLGRAAALHISQRVWAQGYYAAAALANAQGDLSRAQGWLLQSMQLYQAIDDQPGIVQVLCILGGVAFDQGKLHDAIAHWSQILPLSLSADLPRDRALALGNLGEAYYHLGDLEQAKRSFEAGLALARQLVWTDVVAQLIGNLGYLSRRQGDLEHAAEQQYQALFLWQQLGDQRQIAILTEQLAATVVAQGRSRSAARLLGAAAHLRHQIGIPPAQPEQRENELTIKLIRAQLSEETWALAYESGAALGLEAMVAEALTVAKHGGHHDATPGFPLEQAV